MARPDGPDPIARESTRLVAAAVTGAQTSLDPGQLREWIPNKRYGGDAFGFSGEGGARDSQFQKFYDHRADLAGLIAEYSPYAHAGTGDPPVFLDYPAQDKPPVKGEAQKDPTHTAFLGLLLEERLKAAGDEVHLRSPPRLPDRMSALMWHLIPFLAAWTSVRLGKRGELARRAP
jgi:hypothetical protein